jgi:hypothetical protein
MPCIILIENIAYSTTFFGGITMKEFIWDSYETLNKCRKTIEEQKTGVYLRFGDGDVILRNGGDDMLQSKNPDLAEEMKEAFSLSGEGIIKSLPLHSDKYGCMPNMRYGEHKWDDGYADYMLNSSSQYFQNEIVYSPTALHYLGVYDKDYTIEFLRFIRQYKPILVGNENIPSETVHKLFNTDVHIKTPPQQCYPHLDRIEKETLSELEKLKNDYKLVVVAMGTTGRVLVKRILKSQKYKVFFFDFGSLIDALCGWNTREWIGLSAVSNNYWEDMLDKISGE